MSSSLPGKKAVTSLLRPSTTATAPVMPECSSRKRSSRSEEHTSELQSLRHLVCRLLLEKKKKKNKIIKPQHKKKTTTANTILLNHSYPDENLPRQSQREVSDQRKDQMRITNDSYASHSK